MSRFAEAFQPITLEEAAQRLQTEGKVIIFVGRSTCPYCLRFEPKLSNVAKALGEVIYFLDSQIMTPDLAAFRQRYQVTTVPGLIVSKSGGVTTVCDSSISEEKICDILR